MDNPTKLLAGKVAIVTGAGGGLGRAHALALAAEGAAVLVNDLGGARDGTGAGNRDAGLGPPRIGFPAAEKVVAEIVAAGGRAAPDYGSVADPESAQAMVQRAVEAFGGLDILVNNAGILRDKSLLKMEDDAWRAVLAVHLDGTFFCGRAAARWMKDAGRPGRIINTTSLAGLLGNFGQSNYGAAKAGIAGLTFTWAKELGKYGITTNAIAPVAKTRLTEDIEAVPDELKPEQVSPVVVFLASGLAKDVNGRIFGVHGRHVFEYKVVQTPGIHGKSEWSPAEIAKRLGEITADAPSATGTGSDGATASPGSSPSPSSLQAPASGLNPAIVGRRFRGKAVFARPEAIRAYAKATNDPHPRYADGAPDSGLLAPPIFGVTLIPEIFLEILSIDHGGDIGRMVHGEQRMSFHGAIGPWDLLSPRALIAGIEDKSSGQILHLDLDLLREGNPVVSMRASMFFRGQGGGRKDKAEATPDPGAPSWTRSMQVTEDQPLRYAEASGDHNPIHVDPDFAKAVGLPRNILHGLCTMAFASQAIFDQACEGDPAKLAEISVRFRAPVLPGDTVTTRAWRRADGALDFDMVNQDGVQVLTNGYARLKE